MRARSTIIGIILLLLSGCGIEPQFHTDKQGQSEISKIKGPDVGTVEGELKIQAEAATARGDYAGAVELYRQLAEKQPDNKDFAVAYADAMRRSGDNDNAIKMLDGILAKDHDNAEALEVKGLCLMNTGEFTDASKVFGDVMKLDSKRWRTLNGIGILFAMKNMDEQAIAYYDAALDQSTNNPSVLNNKGLTLAMDRQYDKAIETFEKAKRHLEDNSREMRAVDLNLALVYAIAGRLNDAQQTAAPHLSKAALYNNMGFYAYLSKNTEMAKGYLNMALTQSPVYYERAWKNLNLLNGETAESTEPPSGSLKASTPSAEDKKVKEREAAEKHAHTLAASHPEEEAKPEPEKTESKEAKPEDSQRVKKDDSTKPPVEAAKTDAASAGWENADAKSEDTAPPPPKKKKKAKKPPAPTDPNNGDAAQPAPASSSNEIPLNEIPESKPAAASPAAGENSGDSKFEIPALKAE